MTTDTAARPPIVDADTGAAGSTAPDPREGRHPVNVFFRGGDPVYRTWCSAGRGTEQLSHTFPLIDLLPYGAAGPVAGLAAGWPQSQTYEGWLDSPDIAPVRTRLGGLTGPSAWAKLGPCWRSATCWVVRWNPADWIRSRGSIETGTAPAARCRRGI